MNPNKPPSELREAMVSLRPYFVRAGWFSLVASLLVLAPSVYMLEVYARVVDSRSHATVGAYVLMEVLEWARIELMHSASVELDQKMSVRIFNAIFEANLRRMPGGTQQPFNDFRQVRDFLFSPALLAMMEAPIALVMMVLLFLISPVLGWSAVAFAILQTAVAWFNERSTKPPLMQANRSAISAQQYADGTLRNAEVIESMRHAPPLDGSAARVPVAAGAGFRAGRRVPGGLPRGAERAELAAAGPERLVAAAQ